MVACLLLLLLVLLWSGRVSLGEVAVDRDSGWWVAQGGGWLWAGGLLAAAVIGAVVVWAGGFGWGWSQQVALNRWLWGWLKVAGWLSGQVALGMAESGWVGRLGLKVAGGSGQVVAMTYYNFAGGCDWDRRHAAHVGRHGRDRAVGSNFGCVWGGISRRSLWLQRRGRPDGRPYLIFIATFDRDRLVGREGERGWWRPCWSAEVRTPAPAPSLRAMCSAGHSSRYDQKGRCVVRRIFG